MKSILKILFALLILAISAVIAGLFLPKQHKIVQILEISVPRQIVYEQISDFRNWNSWSPWLELDSEMDINYGEQTKGQMANIDWKSKTFGLYLLSRGRHVGLHQYQH